MNNGVPDLNWLGRPSGDRLSLRVASYQYPAGAQDKYDRNWLVISGRASKDGLEWYFRDPCMLTFELKELLQWLRWFHEKPKPLTSFIENLLNFSVGGHSELQVRMRGEAVGHELASHVDRWEEGVALHIEVDPVSLNRFTDALEADLKQFPER